MKNLVTLKHGLLITTDLLIAQAFNKHPSDVKQAIRKLECADNFSQRNFTLTSYVDTQGKARPCYEIIRDGFILLIMSFTGKRAMDIKLKYIEAFNEMERQLYGLYDYFNRISHEYDLGFNIASHSGRNLALWRRQKKELKAILKKIRDELQLPLDLEQ